MFVRTPRLYQILTFFACLSFVIGSFFVQPRSAQAAPFTCSSDLYQEISGQLRVLDPLSNTFIDVGPANGFVINAMGYNSLDNYIYAMRQTNSHLLRIEDDGTYTDLGLPTGLPELSYFSGDMDQAGNLYVKGNGDMYKINISTNTATLVPLSDSFVTFELVYINGFLYGIGTGGLGTSLFKVDTTDGTVTALPISIPMFSGYGSGWATDVNSLYFSHNNTGIIYKITNYDTAPIATPVLTSSPTVENDGASCFSAPSPIPDLVANDKVNATLFNQPLIVATDSGLLVGDTGEGISVTSYTQPSHGTVVVNPDGSYTYTPNADFSGTDTFTYTITDEFNNTATATVTITVAGNPLPSNTTITGTLASTGDNRLVYGLFAGLMILFGLATLFVARKSHGNSI